MFSLFPSSSQPFNFACEHPTHSPIDLVQPSPIHPSYMYDSAIARNRLEQALLARERQRLLAKRQEAEAASLRYHLEQQRERQRQAALAQAIREEEERRKFERAWIHREEMRRRAREAEALQAREREIERIRRFQELEAQRRMQREEETEEESIHRHHPFDLLFKALLDPHLHTRPSPSSEIPPLPVQNPTVPPALNDRALSPSAECSSGPIPAASPSTSRPNETDETQETEPASTEEEDEAASIVQRQFRRHLARRQALNALSNLSSSFSNRRTSFVEPTSFTFQQSPSPESSSSPAPRLAFGSANSSFLSYEEFLVNLLSKIDAIQSGGDRQIKQERKQLVRNVEKELARLDSMKERAWEEQVIRTRQETDQEDESMSDDDANGQRQDQLPIAVPLVSSSPIVSRSTPASLSVPSLFPTASQPMTPIPVSTSHLDEDDDPLPEPLPSLTHEAVSSLPLATPRSSSPTPSDSGSSTTSSTLTVSSNSSTVDEYIAEMLRRAHKLGEQVERSELNESANPLIVPSA